LTAKVLVLQVQHLTMLPTSGRRRQRFLNHPVIKISGSWIPKAAHIITMAAMMIRFNHLMSVFIFATCPLSRFMHSSL
jgi:hypothetical protein